MPPNPSSVPSTARRRLARVATVAGLVLLVGLLAWEVDWAALRDLLTRGESKWLLVLLLGLLSLEALLDGAALRAALPPGAGWLPVAGANQVGALANRLLPLDSGDAVKMALLSRVSGTEEAIAGTRRWNTHRRWTEPLVVVGAALIGWLAAPAMLRTPAGWVVIAAAIAFAASVRLATREHGGDAGGRTVPRRAVTLLAAQLGARLASLAVWATVLQLLGYLYAWPVVVLAWAATHLAAHLVSVVPARLGTVEASAWAAFAFVGLEPAAGLLSQVMLTVLGLAVAAGFSLVAPKPPAVIRPGAVIRHGEGAPRRAAAPARSASVASSR